MIRRLKESPLSPWAGLFLGAAAWFAHHQLGSAANFWDCTLADGAYVLSIGLACALVAAAGGFLSWWARVPQPARAQQNREFARLVGMAAAALFLLAIGFQALAGAIVPACRQ